MRFSRAYASSRAQAPHGGAALKKTAYVTERVGRESGNGIAKGPEDLGKGVEMGVKDIGKGVDKGAKKTGDALK